MYRFGNQITKTHSQSFSRKEVKFAHDNLMTTISTLQLQLKRCQFSCYDAERNVFQNNTQKPDFVEFDKCPYMTRGSPQTLTNYSINQSNYSVESQM